ncbi:ATPase [Clostridium carboxidivorans P7]|uniref:ATPase associated with various cellular activities AAA_5 n=1 Tax=Clostridium carboxidivorans P7 TaxID=536227 RepID=C6PTS2_9CLOT|nr:MoxR family ATPase [Clostridium carboxidivorans]AKN30659.1 ATPase [Clostridium carboxidivorans P7]EET87408.1 ATPase associated with various cellular activities AAA_5 [Clostridium carboxidivorans P7]EFG86417.1 ATPase family associated with various cellular activities (AAA) [Clostridium carboxidivorans P7]
MLNFLKKEGISENLITEIKDFQNFYKVSPDVKYRIPKPKYNYYGKEIWEEAITAILCGENLLLVGPKATGKNVLAENLAAVFQRPSWDISFHVNTDSSSLIGTDTFKDGEVVLRHGPIYQCAALGGFGILDEINMAKNESIALLHAALDFRRIIDVPGYDKFSLKDETRFIATMNYGYAGTRELNEALVSRFMVIEMPTISSENLRKLLKCEFPNMKNEYAEQFTGLFQDIQKKSESSEISTKSVDLRGLLSSIHLMNKGLEASKALKMGITNKSFDSFEKDLIDDVIRLRIPEKVERGEIFTD